MIDTHAHLLKKSYGEDLEEAIRIANQEAIRNKKSAVKAHKQEAMSENSKLSAQTARDIYNFVSLDFDDLDDKEAKSQDLGTDDYESLN